MQFVDPILSEYDPAMHFEQVDPARDEKRPFAQGMHDDALNEDDDPAGQSRHATDPAALYVPEVQFIHFNQLLSILVPAGQGMHDDLSGDDSDPLGHFGQNEYPVEFVK